MHRWINIKQAAFLFVLAFLVASPPALAQTEQSNNIQTLYIDKEPGRIIVRLPHNNLGEEKFAPAPDDAKQRARFKAIIDAVQSAAPVSR